MFASIGARRTGTLGTSVWFAVWFVLAAGSTVAVFSLLSVGIFLLPVLLVLTALVATRRGAYRAWPGAVSGAGLPFLLVAYLNRGGPGTVCHTTALEQACTDEWSPWPFLAVGVAALVAGGVIQYARRRRAA